MKSAHGFTVFIDESGDEGFKFRDPPEQKGSSDWFLVSAVISMSAEQKRVIELGRSIRSALGLEKNSLIHWTDLSHERRVRAYSEMSKANLRYVSVLVDKREIRNPEIFKAARGRLYYYAVRLLLERVSWVCRDTARKRSMESSLAKVIFEHRKRMNHEDLVAYVNILKSLTPEEKWIAESQEDIRIDWNVIDADLMETAGKRQYAGLQLADMVASGNRAAVETTVYGYTEHRYAKWLLGNTYRHNEKFSSYGLKFFPALPGAQRANMHWFYKHCGK